MMNSIIHHFACVSEILDKKIGHIKSLKYAENKVSAPFGFFVAALESDQYSAPQHSLLCGQSQTAIVPRNAVR